MANNQYTNKVEIGNDTIIDLTSDTVTPSKLAAGETAHDRSGAPITGTAVDLDGLTASTTDPTDDDLFVTKENGGSWVKKSLLKLYNYIKDKLGIYIGTTTDWGLLSDAQKAKYKLLFFTDDGETGTAYDIPYKTSDVGTALDSINNDLTKHSFAQGVQITQGSDYTIPSDGYLRCVNGSITSLASVKINGTVMIQFHAATAGEAYVYTLPVRKGMIVNGTNLGDFLFFELT